MFHGYYPPLDDIYSLPKLFNLAKCLIEQKYPVKETIANSTL